MQSTVLAFLLLVSVASAHFGGLFKNLNDKQKEELKAILHNQDSTRTQTHQAVKEWVSKQGADVQKAFEEAEKKKDEWKAKHAEKHAEKLKNASPEAKQLDEQLSAIWKNDNLTKKQSCEQVNEIVGKASDKIKQELHLEVRDCSKPFQHGGHKGQHRGQRHHEHKQA